MIAHFKPFLSNAGLLRQEYDVQRGYVRLTAQAKAHSPYGALAPTTLIRKQGFDVVRCLAPEDVPQFRERVLDEQGTSRFRRSSSAEMAATLQSMVSDALHLALVTALGSDYAFLFGEASATLPLLGPDPSPEEMVSFLWHCDGGPQDHLKILLYLDDPADHNGATAVIDRETSQKLALTGYNFCPLAERLADLSDLASEAQVPLVERHLAPQAGEAIVFSPTTVLHKGVHPTFGRRRVFTAGVVPFPLHWAQSLPSFLPCIQQNTHFDFPRLIAG